MKHSSNFWLVNFFWGIMLFISCGMAIIFVYITSQQYKPILVMREHKTVTVDITRANESQLGTNHSYYLHFNYQGEKQFIKVNSELFGEAKISRTIKLFHLPEYRSIFLPPNYDAIEECASFVLLTMLFIFCACISVSKLYNHNKMLS